MAGTLHRLELEGIRVDQEQQLDATCIIWRELSAGTIDRNTAAYSNPSTVTVYDGPCYFTPIVSRRDRFDIFGEQQIYQNQNRVLIPWDAATEDGNLIKIGDILRITASEDEILNLRDQVIKDVLMVSDIAMRRLTTIDIAE